MEQTFLITFSSGKIIILHKQNKFDNSLVESTSTVQVHALCYIYSLPT